MQKSIGATLQNSQCRFTVWAPQASAVRVKMVAPQEKFIDLQPEEYGYWTATAEGVQEGTRYFYDLDGLSRPDPASVSQPEGVHGPSEVVNLQKL